MCIFCFKFLYEYLVGNLMNLNAKEHTICFTISSVDLFCMRLSWLFSVHATKSPAAAPHARIVSVLLNDLVICRTRLLCVGLESGKARFPTFSLDSEVVAGLSTRSLL